MFWGRNQSQGFSLPNIIGLRTDAHALPCAGHSRSGGSTPRPRKPASGGGTPAEFPQDLLPAPFDAQNLLRFRRLPALQLRKPSVSLTALACSSPSAGSAANTISWAFRKSSVQVRSNADPCSPAHRSHQSAGSLPESLSIIDSHNVVSPKRITLSKHRKALIKSRDGLASGDLYQGLP